MKSIKLSLIVTTLLLAASALTTAGEAPLSHSQSRHVIYLHGRIVQVEQSSRPQHPEYGYYEVEKILDTFRGQGFVVSGEIRPKSATVSDSADRVVEQVRQLLESGVPADHITIIGASMGAGIALVASARLQNPDLRFSVLGTCLSGNVQRFVAREGKGPVGHILAVREATDELTGSCPAWKDAPESSSSLVAREIVLETGLRHGFLYRPIPEWVNPVVEWAGGGED
jgi:pimeloyl-ACP methyl ester carboxylesterase